VEGGRHHAVLCHVSVGGVDKRNVLKRLTVKKGIDDVKYVSGAVIWRVDRDKLTRSGMMKLTSDELYRQMTIRNCNTVRKLADMMKVIRCSVSARIGPPLGSQRLCHKFETDQVHARRARARTAAVSSSSSVAIG